MTLTHSDARRVRSRSIRLAAALLVAAVAVLTGLILPTTAAHAAEVPSAITGVTLDKSSYGYNERQKLAFTWSVPDSASAGDTFTLALPPELTVVSQAPFVLRDASGAAVADAAWHKQADGSYDIVFTLTDYADTHDQVGGTGFVATQWNHSVVTTTGGPVNLDFDGIAVQVTIDPKPAPNPPCTQNCPPPPPVPTSRSLGKGGSWADGSFEGTRDASDNINWTVALPGNTAGYVGPIDVADTPAAGSVIDCGTVKITTQDGLASGTPKSVLDPSRYTLDCDPSGFDLTLDRIAANEFVTLTYKGTITDQDAGRFGNHVAFTAPGVTSTKDTTMVRTSQGGDGGGLQSVSVGDYVWLDTDHDGIQDGGEKGIPGVTLRLTGPDGAPVTSVSGTPVGPTMTDASGDYSFAGLPVLAAGQHYTVTIDAPASAPALAGLTPTVAGAGGDRGTDSSTGSATSSDLTTNGASDPTLDFGFVGKVSVGDDVWFDADKDGVQGPDEHGIAGVTLDLTGPDGAPVATVAGTPVAPAVTDAQGHYLFENLPTLPAGQHYAVTIDQAASAAALAGMVSSPEHAGTDTAADSSTASAKSGDLPSNGDQDLTLDFGFYLPDLPTDALPVPSEPTQLAHTGVDGVAPAAALAGGLIVLGMAGFALSRRRTAPERRH
jgi:hypothetical protein